MGIPVTVHFPKPVYRRLQQQARVMKQPVDEIVVGSVQRGLPAWMNRFPEELEKELECLDRLSSAQLRKLALSKLSRNKQRRLETLLHKNSEGTMTAKEEAELDGLHLETSLATLKKAKALVLLKSRGEILPTLVAESFVQK